MHKVGKFMHLHDLMGANNHIIPLTPILTQLEHGWTKSNDQDTFLRTYRKGKI